LNRAWIAPRSEDCGVISHTVGTWTNSFGGRLWPAVNPATSQSHALVVARTIRSARCLSARMGKAQSLEVVLSHTRICSLCRASTKKVAVPKVTICFLENNCPCITSKRGKLLAGDSEGISITSSVGRRALGWKRKKPGNSRPLPNE
jgi:hypothetical protein